MSITLSILLVSCKKLTLVSKYKNLFCCRKERKRLSGELWFIPKQVDKRVKSSKSLTGNGNDTLHLSEDRSPLGFTSTKKEKFSGSDDLLGEVVSDRRPMVTFSSLQKNGGVLKLSEEMSADAEDGKC